MEIKKLNLRFGVIAAIILVAAMSRLLPHLPNFAPVGGMALFGAAYYSKRRWAFIVPVAAMWISDIILNNIVYSQYFDGFVWFYGGSIFTYGAFALITLLGIFVLKKISIFNLTCSVLAASVIFFLISNFGAWLSMADTYPRTFSGLQACYFAGIPFFRNTLLGDIFYTSVLFGTFEILQYRFPILRLQENISE
ncbi:MAG: hypothetical protein LBS69_01875 [Prevotellaceae bacterium]|jgi:hypothetical protein|nr:hypothetical protein [Prevotellaceae bacterium]